MAITTKSNPGDPLFVSVDIDRERDNVRVTYLNSLRDEVRHVVYNLPVLLVAKLGDAAWLWFSPDCQESRKHCSYDYNTKEIIDPIADEEEANFLQNLEVGLFGGSRGSWEDIDDVEIPQSDLQKPIFDLDEMFKLDGVPQFGHFDPNGSLPSGATNATGLTVRTARGTDDLSHSSESLSGAQL